MLLAKMHVVTRKHLAEVEERYPDAAKEIQAWNQIAKAARWQNFTELREVFKDADTVDGYVIFNIRRNRYRLVTIIHYSRKRDGRITEGHIYIRSFLTHKQYENRINWDKGGKR
ncbi:MAG: type II toxin-antitoxin system HigB family toxin [Acidobacteriaceae bacterium]